MCLLVFAFALTALAMGVQEGKEINVDVYGETATEIEKTVVPVGNEALRGLCTLPLLRTGTWLTGTSSHDVTGGNDDGFQGNYSYLYKEGDEYVLLDEYGPGCVYVVRTIGHTGNLHVYLDNATEPSFTIPFPELHAGETPPFLSPLVGDEKDSHGSSWCYTPIPFNQRCRLTTDEMGKPHFLTTFVHKFAQGTKVTPFDPEATLDSARAWWSNPAALLPNGGQRIASKAVLAPGNGHALVNVEGAGAITSLRLHLPEGDAARLADLSIHAYWDGREAPYIDSPLGTFFAVGCPRALRALERPSKDETDTEHAICGNLKPQSLFVGQADDGWFYCHLPMPYWKSARIEVVNESLTESVEIESEIDVSREVYPELDTGYFHALWRQENPLRPGQDFCVLDTRGHGHYIGCVMTFSTVHRDSPNKKAWAPRLFLEGDARFYTDGSQQPLVTSTGTEEYFNWGWYDMLPHDQVFQFPTHGYPLHRIDREDHSVMYRFHLTDLAPYYRAFRFELEHGPEGRVPANYSGTAFLYQRDTATLALTDELDLGDPASESAHEYRAEGTIRHDRRTLPYEGSYQLPRTDNDPADRPGVVKDTGHVWNGACHFTARVVPENTGVKLRRRSWYGFDAEESKLAPFPPEPVFTQMQSVLVEVDGEKVGDWIIPPTHARNTWRDTEYEIPAKFTRGKERLTIMLTAMDGSQWDEYTYWIYTYRAPENEAARDGLGSSPQK